MPVQTYPFVDVVDLCSVSSQEEGSSLAAGQSCSLHETVACGGPTAAMSINVEVKNCREWKDASTCSRVWGICVAPPLDQLRCKAVLLKGGAVHHWSGVLERVDRCVRSQGDVLQGQPQSSAALMVLQLQVQSINGETFPALLGDWDTLQSPSQAEPGLLFALQQLVEHGLIPRGHSFVQRSSRRDKPQR